MLGVMQDLYDAMLPGITARQGAYGEAVAAALAEVADVDPGEPVKDRAGIEARVRALEARGVDGLLVVMLTYGPAMRVARTLAHTPLPVCLANIQPVPDVTPAWDMGDLTYNQGIHGAQDTANAMVRAGRAFTVQFMPLRPDLEALINTRAKAAGVARMNNQVAIDMLQPGDVLVVDLFGQTEGGTIVGDNLFYYIMKTTKNGGLVVDGAIRDLEGISRMDMPAYFREAHPSAISNVVLSGINVPVRIGKATVMPGDLVFGDSEGVYFIPPALVEQVMDKADETHIHDEWTRKKFDEGKYKSREIYGSPQDPALKAEYAAYLKKRELR